MLPTGFEPVSRAREARILNRARLREPNKYFEFFVYIDRFNFFIIRRTLFITNKLYSESHWI